VEEVGDDDVEVEEPVGLGFLLRLLGIGIGSRDVDDGKVKMGDGAAGGSEEGLEGAVGRHRHQGQELVVLVLGGALLPVGAVAVGSGERRERHRRIAARWIAAKALQGLWLERRRDSLADVWVRAVAERKTPAKASRDKQTGGGGEAANRDHQKKKHIFLFLDIPFFLSIIIFQTLINV